MKKIIYIYGNLPAYREDFFAFLSDHLRQDDIKLQVFYGNVANKTTKQADSKKFATCHFNTRFLNLRFVKLSRMCGLLKAVKNNNPDGVVFQYNQTNLSEWLVLLYCIVRKIPYAIWGCNYTRASLNKALAKLRERIYLFLYKNATVLIPYGTLYRDYFIKIGMSPNKIIVAQNTINVEDIVEREKSKNVIPRNGQTINILYVGAIAPQKKIESSIYAVAQLVEEGYNVNYDIVGGGKQLDELKILLQSFSDLVQQCILIHGAKYGEELIQYFRKADVYIMPGTGGLGVNEAMAYGLPIISTIGDETVVDLIDGNGKLLRNMGDRQEQVEALKWFLSLSSAERKEMADRSKKIVLDKASLKNMVENHVSACKKMILS